MAHEIQTHDEVILRNIPAWHGLGHVIPNDKTPTELVREYEGLSYPVEQWTLTAHGPDGRTIEIPTHVANVRTDIDDLLGVVGQGYKVVQNEELAKFAEAIALADEKVICETAGTIRNGKRVWFLCKAEAFEIGSGRNQSDVVVPYLLIANGHDGSLSVRVQPTSVRVVCSNTLHMVVPRSETPEEVARACFSVRHTGNIHERIEEARKALQLFRSSTNEFKAGIEKLSQRPVSSEEVQKFFLECYEEQIGTIPVENAEDGPGRKAARSRALSARDSFVRRFDEESAEFGANAWVLANAWTGLLQHDRKARGADDAARVEKRVHSNLFGLNAERSVKAYEKALTLVG